MKKSGSVYILALIFMGSVCSELKPKQFLIKYGYLAVTPGMNRKDKPTTEEMDKAIIKFQSFNGLPQTGIIDKTTEKKMLAPRCGVKDLHFNKHRTGLKWNKTLLTWRISKYSEKSEFSHDQQRRIMSRAFKRWADVTPLIIQETKGQPTIDIRFEKKDHGDGYPFDGRHGFLGHAFFPKNGGTHFDDDEIWLNGKTGDYNLETVAAHEFGHALGLHHSAETKSLMASGYQTYPDDFTLHSDDVTGIQSLYGKNPINFCNQSYKSIDAAMRISENDFVFVDNGEVIDGRNRQKTAVQNLFPGGPNWVQAAVYSKDNSKAYLFKDDKVWAYTINSNGQFSLVEKFPKLISNSDSHSPESAVQYNLKDESIFLSKDGFFFEFMTYFEDVSPDVGYNASAFFRGVPSKVDAAISSDHEINFVVGKQAYTMLNNKRVVSNKGKPTNLVFKKCHY